MNAVHVNRPVKNAENSQIYIALILRKTNFYAISLPTPNIERKITVFWKNFPKHSTYFITFYFIFILFILPFDITFYRNYDLFEHFSFN